MINVNTVYKSVLSILNKEQRGYLTPDEFNKLAKIAQLNLLEVSFAEYNKFLSMDTLGRINAGYADLPTKIKEKIDIFIKTQTLEASGDTHVLPTDMYKLIEINTLNNTVSLEQIDRNELSYILSSPLTKPSKDFPVYYQKKTALGKTTIVTSPTITDTLKADYIKLPSTPRFGYTTNSIYGTNTYDSAIYVEGGLIIGNTLTIPTVTATNAGITSPLATTAVSPSTGSGATIQLTTGGGNITEAKIINAGSGYKVGDVIKITDAVMEADNTIGLTGGDLNITITSNDLYNTTTQGSTDFELHVSEEPILITAILGMAGIVVKDQGIVTLASQAVQSQAALKAQ